MALEEEKEAAETSPYAGHRGLLITVLLMGVLIVVALGAVVYGIVYKMSAPEESEPAAEPPAMRAAAPYTAILDMPPGGRATEAFAVGNWLVIAVARPEGGAAYVVIDPATGQEFGRIVAPAPPP